MAIQWRDQPILDSVQLPGSDTKYWVADREAREKIESLIGATRFMGVTTTVLKDGDTTNPITINEEDYTAQTGDIVIYTPLTGPSLEFIWDGTKWQLLGGQAIEGLGDLAYKNSASGSYTPEGSINLTPATMDVVTSVSDSFFLNARFSNEPTEGLSSVLLNFSGNSISYFGSSQALNYVNLSNYNSEGSYYTSIVTGVDLYSRSAINDFTPGTLPTISNQSAITVAMGTGSSSTTLIFNLSDIGFDPGTNPTVNYCSVYVPSSSSDVKYTSVSFLTLNPTTTNISGTTPLYYSVTLTGGLDVQTSSVLSGITATFEGSASTITVS